MMPSPPSSPFLRFSHADVHVLERQTVYRGFGQVDTLKLQHRMFATGQFGAVIQRELVLRRPAVGVLIHDPALQQFVLIEQFRVGAIGDPVSPWQLEIVAGLVDDGESPEQAVRREALEETGVVVDHVQELFEFYPTAGGCNEVFGLYVATANLQGAGGIHGAVGEGEDIRVHCLPYHAIPQLLGGQARLNAPVIVALQWLLIQSINPVGGEDNGAANAPNPH